MILRDMPYGIPQDERKNNLFTLLTKNRIIIFILSLSMDILISASPGCMDNSWHMERPFDNKEYHIVTREVGKHKMYCPCSCRKMSLNRGECLECHHRHDIQPWIIVRKNR